MINYISNDNCKNVNLHCTKNFIIIWYSCRSCSSHPIMTKFPWQYTSQSLCFSSRTCILYDVFQRLVHPLHCTAIYFVNGHKYRTLYLTNYSNTNSDNRKRPERYYYYDGQRATRRVNAVPDFRTIYAGSILYVFYMVPGSGYGAAMRN